MPDRPTYVDRKAERAFVIRPRKGLREKRLAALMDLLQDARKVAYKAYLDERDSDKKLKLRGVTASIDTQLKKLRHLDA
jgi:hypothetical protein